MIAFITGTVESYGSDWLIVDHGGMGWKVSYAHTDKIHLNEEVKVFTYLHYTEAELSLYGFESQQEMDLFLRLISVKGLGPKTAMNMLAKASADKIITAVETGDVSVLKSMPGIGAKTASQIVLDLKGKLVPVTAKTKQDQPSYPIEIRRSLRCAPQSRIPSAGCIRCGRLYEQKPAGKHREISEARTAVSDEKEAWRVILDDDG